jgi:hypothetical protein
LLLPLPEGKRRKLLPLPKRRKTNLTKASVAHPLLHRQNRALPKDLEDLLSVQRAVQLQQKMRVLMRVPR